MVNVARGERDGPGDPEEAYPPEYYLLRCGSTPRPPTITFPRMVCTGNFIVPLPTGEDPATRREQLALLKAQLQHALEEIEKQERASEARPRKSAPRKSGRKKKSSRKK
ncbi:MAG: hypothetical protein ABI231_08740 [Candidatus Tumulicola sp.]